MRVDQRRSRRIPCNLPVTWLRLSNDVKGIARNISLEGMFVELETAVEVGFIMRLRVDLPDGPVNAVGEARFAGDTATGHGCGILIFTLGREDQQRWQAHYHSLAAMSGPRPQRDLVKVGAMFRPQAARPTTR